ncbi:LysR family transcriptional regulator [Bordetella genomosp. 1]|uniref:LysR family transcriptional regulator n=1 Tax=Bordetella genomosp. 1 TaxID=1395607 RepID=A0ABX4EYZ9_9BORD|nr:LysR family transcriptional regulator [Bordetella genomosp. 1]OZI64982.1 LysR family transcriptional regulator [Bordetella genomosp. 1]
MIRELKTLVAVAREGTFAAAGDRIGLTQAAVSAQMQRLEAELGFALFDRRGRAAHLNHKGRQVLRQAQDLLRLYGQLGSGQTDAPTATLITLGAIASVHRLLLPDALARFHQQHPHCRSHVIPGISLELINLVDAGDVDLAAIIRPPFTLHSDLRWTTLAQEPFKLLVPRAVKGRDWAELLTREPFIRYDRASFGGRQVDRFLRDRHIAPHEVCELDELETIVALVARGVGVALVPQTAALGRWPAGVRALDLGKHVFHRDIGLVHRAAPVHHEEVRALAHLLVALARPA